MWGAFVAIGLGILQICAGAMLCFFSAGAAIKFGVGLIIEGTSDIIKGVIGLLNGEFDFDEYLKEKGISLMLTAVFAGPAAMKETFELMGKGLNFVA